MTISTLPNESWGVEEYKDIALMRLGDLAGGEENIQLKDTKMGGQPAIQARYASPSAGTTNLHVFTGAPLLFLLTLDRSNLSIDAARM